MLEAIPEKSWVCGCCSLEERSVLEMQIYFLFKKDINGLFTSCLACSVHVRTFFGFFSWQCS